MIGLVLAAGRSRRLGTLTDDVPKTLLPVADDAPIIEIIFRNLADVGLRDVVVVTGYRDDVMRERLPGLATRYGLGVETIYNDKHLDWNNCYSLWLARASFGEDVLLVNGDTVHPASVERTVLKQDGPGVVLAMDDQKPLADEEMKIVLDERGRVTRLHKGVDPARAHGEYIGVTRIFPDAAEPLAAALEATWRRDVSLYYEDGFQEYADRGGLLTVAPIGVVDWVEVDNAADLERAREIACRY